MTDTTPTPQAVTPEAVEKLREKLRSQVGDDIQVIFNHESLFKQSDAMLEALAADRDAQTARADAAEARDELLEGNATEQHWDDHCVNQFAKMMREKMALSRAKGRSGWNDPNQCSVQYLRELLYEHLDKGDPVDVANICMMLRHYDASTARDYGNTLDMLKHRAAATEAKVARLAHHVRLRVGEALAGLSYAEASKEARARVERAITAAIAEVQG